MQLLEDGMEYKEGMKHKRKLVALKGVARLRK